LADLERLPALYLGVMTRLWAGIKRA